MMQDKKEKRLYGVPKYFYWAKNPPKLQQIKKPLNSQQKKLYLLSLVFNLAKFIAIIVFVVLLLKVV